MAASPAPASSAATKARAEAARNQPSTDSAAPTPSRTTAGARAAQIAARPEPIAIAGAATARVISRLHQTTRAVEGSVSTEAATEATTTATTAYPTKNRATAAGTVKSRSPSAIRSASGPWPDTASPTRWPRRHMAQADIAVTPRGTMPTSAPCTVTPDPWPISHARAPIRIPSLGVPWAPASAVNQPITPTAASTSSGARAAATPPSEATRARGRCRSLRPSAEGRSEARGPAARGGSREVMAPPSSPAVVRRPRRPRRGAAMPRPVCFSPAPHVPWTGHEEP